jgi:hypothetical protein
MSRTVTAVSIALAALACAAPARADVLDTYQRLAERGLEPAPLVPTTVPPILTPIDRWIDTAPTRGARGYSVRLAHYNRSGPDAIVVLTGGEFRSVRAFIRDQRRLGFKRTRSLRIRGHRGSLLTRRLGPLSRTVVWSEGGVVYTIGSGTPRKISLAHLRSIARGLDRLGREWIGSSSDPDSSSGAFAFTTARTISVRVEFQASCTFPGSSEPTARVGQAQVTLMRRQGNSFAFDVGDNRIGTDPWDGTVTGTISATAVTLNVRATGTIAGEACDTGPQTLVLDRRAI